MRHRSSHGRTDPALWEKCKREAVRRLHGRHSARAMQLAGRLYRERGGGYVGIVIPAREYPIDGNHRVRAAQIVGDEWIDAFVPVMR